MSVGHPINKALSSKLGRIHSNSLEFQITKTKFKGASKMLMKLTLGVNFINILRTRFSYKTAFEFLAPKFQTQKPAL